MTATGHPARTPVKPKTRSNRGASMCAREAARPPPTRCGREIVEFPYDGWIMTQMRGADFARMSTSKQLSLWAILRAQLSSSEHLAAQAALATAKTIPASPQE
ncbi:MAG: hypothetical protein ACREYB_04005 [Casimicrobiaceae bacterium]